MKFLEALNNEFYPLSKLERINLVADRFDRILITSSFGTTSAILLHLLSQSRLAHLPVFIVNTGFLFPETLAYRNHLSALLKIKVEEIVPEAWRFDVTAQTTMWKNDPDTCCVLKKVEPLDDFAKGYDLWMSGIMGWQSNHRGKQPIFSLKKGIVKFHPLVDMTKQEAESYFYHHNLPEHPLKSQGYESIGCMPCTQQGNGRNGRWEHLPGKTECGLHF